MVVILLNRNGDNNNISNKEIKKMELREFIKDFVNNHELQTIEEYENGIIEDAITSEIYLVKTSQVKE